MSDMEPTDDSQEPGLARERLRQQPRLVRLRERVASLPVDQEYRGRLLHSIDVYAEHIVARPVYAADEGWDDLEALQQVTLSDWMEMSLRKEFKSKFQN